MQKITTVAALTPEYVIGNGDKIPWYISEDFKQYKEYTLGKPLVMWRKTFESIGRPLPGRRNIILTRSFDTPEWWTEWIDSKKIEIVHSKQEALDICINEKEIIINGGAGIYSLFMDTITHMRLSWVKEPHLWDILFPEFKKEEFDIISEQNFEDFILIEYKKNNTLKEYL